MFCWTQEMNSKYWFRMNANISLGVDNYSFSIQNTYIWRSTSLILPCGIHSLVHFKLYVVLDSVCSIISCVSTPESVCNFKLQTFCQLEEEEEKLNSFPFVGSEIRENCSHCCKPKWTDSLARRAAYKSALVPKILVPHVFIKCCFKCHNSILMDP